MILKRSQKQLELETQFCSVLPIERRSTQKALSYRRGSICSREMIKLMVKSRAWRKRESGPFNIIIPLLFLRGRGLNRTLSSFVFSFSRTMAKSAALKTFLFSKSKQYSMPTPSKFSTDRKRKKDSTPISSPFSAVSFNAFTFVDNLTNSKIVLKDAHDQYHKHTKHHSQDLEHKKKEVIQLNNCVSLLKTTKMFQMDSLRHKLFRSAHHSRQQTFESEQDINETKRDLERMIKTSIEDLSRKELHGWLNGSNKRINPKIMALQRLPDTKLTKANLLTLINTDEQPPQTLKTPKSQKQNPPVYIKEEKELRQKIEHNITAIRANNTFLVRPDSKHELYQKLYTACTRKKLKIKRTVPHSITINDMNSEGIFRPVQIGGKLIQIQDKIHHKRQKVAQSEEERQIICAVENNLFFDMEFLLNTKKNLILCRDKKGNNLLHIAAKNRNLQFFQFLLKRAGPQSLQARNNLGKTPLDVAKLYGVAQIVSAVLNYSPYG